MWHFSPYLLERDSPLLCVGILNSVLIKSEPKLFSGQSFHVVNKRIITIWHNMYLTLYLTKDHYLLTQ